MLACCDAARLGWQHCAWEISTDYYYYSNLKKKKKMSVTRIQVRVQKGSVY